LAWIGVYGILYVPLQLGRMAHRATLPDMLPASDGGGLNPLQLAIEAPLAGISYAHYRSVKWVYEFVDRIQREELYKKKAHAQKPHDEEKAPMWHETHLESQWQRYGYLSRTSIMSEIMHEGPRWNTHCTIFDMGVTLLTKENNTHHFGQFEIENVGGLATNFTWQIEFKNSKGPFAYASPHPQLGTAVTVDVFSEERTLRMELHAYFYGNRETASLPQVRQDGNPVAMPKEVKHNALDLNNHLREKQNLWNDALQWHVFPMLAARNWLPEKFVHEEFLPIDHPDIDYLYGIVLEDYALAFKVPQDILDDHLIFCTVYSRASIPTENQHMQVEGTAQTLPSNKEDGFWLARILRKDGLGTDEGVKKRIDVNLVFKPIQNKQDEL